ncbi:hypothetical protein HERIO_1141 [Hepatospora eriocheir]|uniref:Uncharacterized protein n=1 Tax=Hepatospora eriocheir TaxID=1081669 RepID=A0A1X0QB47_9MICR|nr:hypothetical protein HERIO_1141 [Hepatospora eriocheir]
MIFNKDFVINKFEDIKDLKNDELVTIIPSLSDKSKTNLLKILKDVNNVNKKNLEAKSEKLESEKSLALTLLNRLWNLLEDKENLNDIFNEIKDEITKA